MRTRLIVIACLIVFAVGKTTAQPLGRIFGARSFEVDDGTRSGKTVRWDVSAPLSASYVLHFPSNPPSSGNNFLGVDAGGNVNWMAGTLPPLSQGNIWCGTSGNVAMAMPPGPTGSIFGINPAGMPEWLTSMPSALTIPASQITSGTLQPGTTITIGDGASITPNGTGLIAANQLIGSGPNRYSGSIPIPQNALSMNISYPGVAATSTVLVSVVDQSGQTDQVSVGQITPGIGFTVVFSGFYPGTTGNLNYLVIN